MAVETKPTTPPAVNERSLDWLAAWVVVLALAHFLAAFNPGIKTWGFDYWSTLPLWARTALMLVVAITVVPGVAERMAKLFSGIQWRKSHTWIALVCVFALFIILRSKGYSYGDGYSFRGYFERGAFPTLTGNQLLLTGDILVHWLVYRAAVMPLGGSIDATYAILSALAGVASLAAIAAMAKRVYPKTAAARWALIAAGFASGMASLWFGHVEAYSLVAAALLWSLTFFLMGRVTWGIGLWVIACGLHLLAVAFLPVVVWAVWTTKRSVTLTPRTVTLALIAGFIGWGIAGAVFSVFRPGMFVPLLASENSTYTAFSLAHLSDSLNLLLFAAPLGIAGLFFWMVSGRLGHSGVEESVVGLLTVASASLWYFSFWVDPLIGGFRDWDLLGIFGIPFSLLGMILFMRRPSRHGNAFPHWVLVAVLALAHTGGFVASVQSETAVMTRVDRLVRQDIHYTRDFHQGERLMSWAHILTHVLDEKPRALHYMRMRSEWAPEDANSWTNLGSSYWHVQRYDSAAHCYERARELKPNDPDILNQLALSYSLANDFVNAKEAVESLSKLRELSATELNIWGYSLILAGELPKAESLLTLSLKKLPDQQEAFYYLGVAAEQRFDSSQSLAQYERAMSPQAPLEDVYLRCTRLYQARGQWADGERVATAWREQYPQSTLPPFFMGVCRIAMLRYPEARDALELAISMNPNNTLAHFYLATSYRNLGDLNRAAEAARRAASLDTTLALPYLELLYIADDQGDRVAAGRAAREYMRRSPDDTGNAYIRQFLEP